MNDRPVNGESSVLNVFAIFLPQQLYPSVDRQISQAGIIVRGFNGYDLCIYGLAMNDIYCRIAFRIQNLLKHSADTTIRG